MNRIVFILAGVFSFFYFESKFIQPLWLRGSVYALVILALIAYDVYAGRKKIRHLQELIKETMKGNYSFKFNVEKYDGIFRDVGISIIELRRRLLRYIFEIQVASSQVSAASQQLSINLDDNNAFAQQLYAEAQEMSKVNESSSSNVEGAISEVRNITELLEEVKSTSTQLHDTSRHSKQIIGESLQEIIQIVDAVNDAQKSAESTVECIEGLNVASREISTMLETVDSIAKQTHLLSLNASIESARAGEHGKGFGVVAEEIRKLADDSKNAVSEIALLVNRITAEIETVNAMIDGNLKSINRSAAYTKNIEKSLNRIEESYDRVETMINEIIETSEKEYGLAENLDNKINLVETMTKRVSFGFEVLYESIHKQKHNIEDIAVLGDCLSGASQSLAVLTEKDDINILETNLAKFNSIAHDVIRLIKEEILTCNGIIFMDPQEHKRILDEFLAKYDFIEAAWSNGMKGKFIYSNPPAGIANAKVREWFQESIDGKEFVSPVYISAITRNPCITVSLPIKSDLGLCMGVIGVDLKVGID